MLRGKCNLKKKDFRLAVSINQIPGDTVVYLDVTDTSFPCMMICEILSRLNVVSMITVVISQIVPTIVYGFTWSIHIVKKYLHNHMLIVTNS